MNVRFELAVFFGFLALVSVALTWSTYSTILTLESAHSVLYCVLGTACNPQAYYPQLLFFLMLTVIFTATAGEFFYNGRKQPKQTKLKEYS